MSNHSTIHVLEVYNDPSGAIEVMFKFNAAIDISIHSVSFSSREAMIGQATDPIDSPYKAIPLALAWWARRDPTFIDPSNLVGKLVTIDFSAVVPIKVTNA